MDQLETESGYAQRRAAVAAFNASSKYRKRGLAMVPLKFGISFTATMLNQGGALVNIYQDGSVSVNHGGTEMGQGLNTKMAQVAADGLGIPVSLVRVTGTDTQKVPNASATSASSGRRHQRRGHHERVCARCASGWLEVAARMLKCDAPTLSNL
jgi:xanthine dehydrogenase large subunit